MLRVPRLLLVSMLLGSIIPATAAATAETASPVADEGYAHPDWLVDGARLRAILAGADPVVVVALTPAEEFARGHIPGAVQIDWPALEIVETGDGQLASWRTGVEAILTGLGITPADTVVIYDGGTFAGARFWWILDQLGHADKRMLNGGLASWTAAGGELATGPASPAPAAEPYVGAPNEDAIATIAEVEQVVSMGDAGAVLVDARRPDEFAAGHLPGAINIPFTDNAHAGDALTWKSAAELRAMYAGAGVSPDAWVIPYCTRGVRAAATYFTLRLIGYERVSLFTGSFMEWSADASRPVTTGAAP